MENKALYINNDELDYDELAKLSALEYLEQVYLNKKVHSYYKQPFRLRKKLKVSFGGCSGNKQLHGLISGDISISAQTHVDIEILHRYEGKGTYKLKARNFNAILECSDEEFNKYFRQYWDRD